MTFSDALPRLAALLLAVGVLGGTALDPVPARPVTMRGSYRVLEADFHAHTRFSDGFLSPFDLVLQARRRGLDALAITEHNITFPAFMGRWFSGVVGGPAILVGEEITTRRYHLIAVGLTERVNASAPLHEVLEAIHRQGGVAVAAHPIAQFQPAFEAEIDHLDAAEVMHPIAYNTERGRTWRWGEMRDFYERALASGHRLTAIGSSDYHAGSPLGVTRTLVFAKDDSAGAVLEALEAGRTVVYDLEGRPYGDPVLSELLTREPYPMREQDYGYRGTGLADRVTRVLGWVGLLGLVLFGSSRRAR
jgi:predicted metal-dependent phosphoesterase TrpH